MKLFKYNYLLIISFVIGMGCLMGSLYIPAKAQLAQYLLEQSWQQSKLKKLPIKPWPWADMFPVARMKIPSIKLDVIVLFGSSGETLAFAPGHISESVKPGNKGNSLISAHKDTHFQNIDQLRAGDRIYIERADGQLFEFLVSGKRIVNTREDKVSLLDEQSKLSLITCFPLKGAYSDPNKRFIVYADNIEEIK